MMNRSTKKAFRSIFAAYAMLLVVGGFLPQAPVQAAVACSAANDPGCDYIPLTTIPGATVGCTPTTVNGKINTDNCTPTNPVNVIKNIYGISIGIAAALAVVMIIWAGVQYATTESISGHSDAKAHWEGALWGLIILLSSYLILRTINVDLVNINLDLGVPQHSSPSVGVNPFSEILAKTEVTATQAISDNQTLQEAAQKKIADLESQMSTLKSKIDSAVPNSKEAQQLQAQYKELESERNTTQVNAQASTVAAAATVGTRSVAREAEVGNTDGIKSAIASTNEILDKQIYNLVNANAPQSVLDSASAQKIAFNGLANQQIVATDSLNKLQTEVHATILQDSLINGFNISAYPSYQSEILEARKSFSQQYGESGNQIRKLDTAQADQYNKDSLAQLNAFDKAIASSINCPNGIVVTADTVSCKQ